MGIGYLVLRESVLQRLPTMYFALRIWRHNRKWVDTNTLPDEHVLSVHKVGDAQKAELAATAFLRYPTSGDRFECVSCAKVWNWNDSTALGRVPAPGVRCCHKTPVDRY